MRPVYVSGAGMTRFAKHPDRNFRSLATEAAQTAVRDAGIEPGRVEFVAFGNAAAGILTDQEMIRAQIALLGSGLEGVPMVNVENACASASSAFHLAWTAVAAGQCELALAMGTEKMTHPDKKRAFVALGRAVDVEALVKEQGEAVLTEGPGPLFMDLYASEARAYMERSGATQRDFAEAAAKNHTHGSLNPHSQFQRAVDVEEVLASRLIADPLTLMMCSPIGDGAAALVLCSEEAARSLGRAEVRVLGCVLGSGRREEEAGAGLVVRTARRAYELAGVGPEDLDLVELHDAASPAELIISEELGLAQPGEGPALLRSGATRLGGRIPINPSGGLVSKGHPVGATGCAQLVEIADQLRDRCGPRQVEGARIGLTENAGGWLGSGPAACVVTVLGRA